jgi:hypothetical protein
LLRKIVIVSGTLFLSILILLVSYAHFVGFIERADFDMSVSPQTLTLLSYEGSSNQTIITLSSINGFDENISLSIGRELWLMGVRVSLDFNQVHVLVNRQVQVRLSFYVITEILPGSYYVDVFANCSGISHSVRVSVNVPDQMKRAA